MYDVFLTLKMLYTRAPPNKMRNGKKNILFKCLFRQAFVARKGRKKERKKVSRSGREKAAWNETIRNRIISKCPIERRINRFVVVVVVQYFVTYTLQSIIWHRSDFLNQQKCLPAIRFFIRAIQFEHLPSRAGLYS